MHDCKSKELKTNLQNAIFSPIHIFHSHHPLVAGCIHPGKCNYGTMCNLSFDRGTLHIIPCPTYTLERYEVSILICHKNLSSEIYVSQFVLCYNVVLYIFRGAYRFLKLLLVVYTFQKRNITVAKAFAKTVKKYRSKTCLLFEDTSWSFQDLEDYSNKVGNYFLDLGYKVLHILGLCAI